MIPKILHYCWYGDNALSEINEKCLASWKKLMPDYEIMKWDESNSKMDLPFMKEAYQRKRFGYLIDHTRLYALELYGGFFLDLDMLLFKRLDQLLDKRFCMGLQNLNELGTAFIGAEKKTNILSPLKKIYEEYDHFTDIPSTGIATHYFESIGITNFLSQSNDSHFFLDVEYFFSFPLGAAYREEKYTNYVTSKSIGVHLWENTWIKPEFRDFWFGNPIKGYKKVAKRILLNPFQGVHYYKDLGYHFLRHLGLK